MFEIVAAVLGIPSALYGAIQLWQYLLERGWMGATPTEALRPAPPGPRDPARVLLTFDRANMDRDDTWEGQITSYHRRLPNSYREIGIQHPDALKLLNRGYRMLPAMMLFFSSTILFFLVMMIAKFDARPDPSIWQRIVDVVLVLVFSAGAVAAFMQYRKHWRASKIIDDYETFFHEQGYDLNTEFTQAKAKYEAAQSVVHLPKAS